MFYLLRHGLDDETYVGGWSDVSLIDEGVKQVLAASYFIKENLLPIKEVISSPILRARQTSEIITKELNIKTYSTDDLLKEQDKGLLNGLNKKIAIQEFPTYFDCNLDVFRKYPEGESLLDLYKRIKNNLDYFASIEENTLLVTHRGVINMLYYILNDIPLDMDKNKFHVDHASLHTCDIKKKIIRKVL